MHPQGSDMTSAKMPATIVNVKVVQGKEGLFYATSPELKGLLVAEHSEEAVWAAIPTAIQEMYEACGENVIVMPAASSEEHLRPWIATRIPAIEAALAAAQNRHHSR